MGENQAISSIEILWEFTASYIGMEYREKVKPTKEAKEMRRKRKTCRLRSGRCWSLPHGLGVKYKEKPYYASPNNPAKPVLSAPAKSTELPKIERRHISPGIQCYAPDIQQLL